jgi:predicted DNA-binding transcriptional regulator AlpA
MVDKAAILEKEGLIRLPDVLKIIPVSRSTWLKKVKNGEAPRSFKLGPRITGWKVSDIRNYLEGLTEQQTA